MFTLVVLSAVVAAAVADAGSLFNRSPFPQRFQPTYPKPAFQPVIQPQVYPKYSGGPQIRILKSESDISPDGRYYYIYETENGISAQEQGTPKAVGSETPVVATGAFQYTSPEGVPVQINYVADENGFQPSGNVLPTPPPIPEAILRSIQFNAAQERQPARRF